MAKPTWKPTPGELIADRFRLEEELGRGGMGSVWLAHHTGLDMPCAVKFIDSDAEVTDEHRTRFRQEARAAAKLRSRYVVQMFDYGLWREWPYIAMELLEGETLAERLEDIETLEPREILAIMRGCARAVVRASELGIVHRDLKPDNIFLVREAGEDHPKILDFGIAKLTLPRALQSDLKTASGALLGTPWYMSPEQIDGTRAVDLRADLWSLSVIAYECLTGELPFDSTALGNLMIKIVSGPRPVPSKAVEGLPAGFDAWWLRAAAPEPDDRFDTPELWFAALSEALLGPEWPAMASLSGEETMESLPRHVPLSTPGASEREADASVRIDGPDDDDENLQVEAATLRRDVSDVALPKLRAGAETFGGQWRRTGDERRAPRRRGALVAAAVALVGIIALSVWWSTDSGPEVSAEGDSPATGAAVGTSSLSEPAPQMTTPTSRPSESPESSVAPSASASASAAPSKRAPPPPQVSASTPKAPPRPPPVVKPPQPPAVVAPPDPGF